jgi:hypothetical protein
VADVFVAVTEYKNEPVVFMMRFQLGAEVVDGLKAGVRSAVATLAKDVPLLGKDGMNTSLLNAGLAAVVVEL